MHQPGKQTAADRLTKRQHEVLERLELGMGARQIARDIGITRNAVYQHIERLRRLGALSATFTPSGQPPRRAIETATPAFAPAAAPRESALATLRELALAGVAPEAGEEDDDRRSTAYAQAIEGAIANGDALALAYELGRLDASGQAGLPLDLVESALRRQGALAPLDNPGK